MSESSKIYIDIESLLDVRQGVLSKMLSEEDLLALVTSDEYNIRDTDEFKVDMTQYRSLRDSGTLDILKDSTVTYMEVVLRGKIDNICKRNAFNHTSDRVHVVVNTYPYQLTEKQAELIRNATFVRLGECCDVSLLYDSPSVWNPTYIKASGVYAFYGYSFGKWMQENCSKLETTELREVQMYFASVGEKAVTPEEMKAITKLGFKDIFSYTEYLLASVTKLTLLPVVFYTNVITATAFLKKNAPQFIDQSLG